MKEIDELPLNLDKLLQEINQEVLSIIGKRIKKIGKLKEEDLAVINKLIDFYGEDNLIINKKLAEITNKTIQEVETILLDTIKEAEIDTEEFYNLSNVEQVPFEKNNALKTIYANTLKNLTNDILNISNTSVLGFVINGTYTPFKNAYLNLINKSILAITTGTMDFNTALQSNLKDIGIGAVVKYPSGRVVRADSAVRMNILDGVRKLTRDIRQEQGKEFGATGVYILPHGLCADDHLPYQGKEYLYKDFEELNARLDRPIGIGVMNCRHIAYDVIVGESLLPYSKDELKKINQYSTEIVTWNGRKMTRYEATQKMRNAETHIRELKDKQFLFKNSGDKINENRYKKYSFVAEQKYKNRCNEADLKPRLDRL